MNPAFNELLHSIQTGFVDKSIHSKREYRPQLLVNDKVAGKKILSTLDRELKYCDEFWLSVAFVTTSGLATIMNRLKELENKNISGRILASQYLSFTQPEALRRIKKFKNIELKIATEGSFHAKGYLFRNGENYNLIIGSSNLTAGALCSNQEWNLKVTGTSHSELMTHAIQEFQQAFDSAVEVTDEFLKSYEQLYMINQRSNQKISKLLPIWHPNTIIPNKMQMEALENIRILRSNHKEKALLISATGTGKTYLSAFDVKAYQPKTFLFVVHRQTIAREAMKTFKTLLGTEIKMGLYSGDGREIDADYIFCTIQTISRPEHLEKFDPQHFDYIVIDETHRAGANSYRQVMEYFKPKFLLGMTATPERTDGLDIFKLFDYNIAYEIRLHQALSDDMLCPFHYYGVTDLTIDNEIVDDTTEFNLLVDEERVDRIIEKSRFYSTDDGTIRGLIFTSRKEECHALAAELNRKGYKTIALTGDDPESKRADAIRKLEESNLDGKLDYILTVDIFNEGVDIPKVNQIIMLRPTQSAIIFVQQLGRGLRKTSGKEYLTVIDFIGNYTNNYMVPIALYGDTSYNKDNLRNLLSSGSQTIPGSSTINFDQITKERIFAAIDGANMQTRKELIQDYKLLKFKIGRIPLMVDFLEHGSRDPYLVAGSKKSHYNFVKSVEDNFDGVLNNQQVKYLEYFTSEINNSKRVEESLLLEELLANGIVEKSSFQFLIESRYGYKITEQDIVSYVRNLNFEFITQSYAGKLVPVRQIYNFSVAEQDAQSIWLHKSFKQSLENVTFKEYLLDTIQCSIKVYDKGFSINKYEEGFLLYKKYSRKDVFRILNWETNPVAQNVGGYMISPDKLNCPVFVNYQKHEDISSTTKYEDVFLNNQEFQYMSKSRRTLESSDVQTIRNYHEGFRIPLFIKKSNDEGLEFYFMGDIVPQLDAFEQTTMPNDGGTSVSVVKMVFSLKHPVEDNLYEYLKDANAEAVQTFD